MTEFRWFKLTEDQINYINSALDYVENHWKTAVDPDPPVYEISWEDFGVPDHLVDVRERA